MERPFTLDHLNHIVLRVRDLPTSLAFYRMLVGDVQGERRAGTVVRIGRLPSIILQEQRDYIPAGLGELDHLNHAIRALDMDDVVSYLRTQAAEITREPETGRAVPGLIVRDP